MRSLLLLSVLFISLTGCGGGGGGGGSTPPPPPVETWVQQQDLASGWTCTILLAQGQFAGETQTNVLITNDNHVQVIVSSITGTVNVELTSFNGNIATGTTVEGGFTYTMTVNADTSRIELSRSATHRIVWSFDPTAND